MTETAAIMHKSYGAVLNKASELHISFHGPSGAPFLNHNNGRARIRRAVAGGSRWPG